MTDEDKMCDITYCDREGMLVSDLEDVPHKSRLCSACKAAWFHGYDHSNDKWIEEDVEGEGSQ